MALPASKLDFLSLKSGVFIATFAQLRFVAAAVSTVAFRIGQV